MHFYQKLVKIQFNKFTQFSVFFLPNYFLAKKMLISPINTKNRKKAPVKNQVKN